MSPRAAAGVPPADLGSYQEAVRLVLTNDLITSARPRPGVLEHVLRWADRLTGDLRELLGYTVVATTRHVRVVRRLDALDDTQRHLFAKNGKPFDRRRLAYLCLVLSLFQRSRVEVSLADLVRAFAPAAGAIGGLGFDPTVGAHKAAVVDCLDWLVERGALRVSDGSLDSWAHDTERGDALFDIDHDICAILFRPARPVQHLTSAAGLLEGSGAAGGSRAGEAARRARRLLVEHPVVYFAEVEPEVAEELRRPALAADLARLTGLVVERRAEGVMLADPGGRFTDKPFPGRGGAVNRAAGLLLAKMADLLEEPGERDALRRVEPPAGGHDQRELLARVDSALPRAGVAEALAWTPSGTAVGGGAGAASGEGGTTGELVLVERARLAGMIHELYAELGAASFSAVWQHDPEGLLEAALTLLAELRLVRRHPGGVLLLPAFARYRNITLALPDRRAEQGRLALDTTCAPEEPAS
ncbi:hypothetical protein Sme01_56400 [Sphaerisporangium melleum]|uniref:TIGR02678 family protein n=1 Tax=Sphaerisporangium melleum TaxID=321316 RepID=A0A917RFS6_9ACTN|nr:DUF2398 family protein [Sphaerisporangium melleum]GGL05783.1 hypothetical protein GCM10007964_55030 [Sphaerisporangium melleum]GII73164.1 hypothetical protein Sme01_56400 [Sphaerisporangium melleum]